MEHSEATEVLRRAEGELRQLLVRTAEQGDYETARLLAGWAEQLKRMIQHNGSVDREPCPSELANEQARSHTESEGLAPTFPNYKTDKAKATRLGQAKRAKGAKREYPKFLRDGQDLLKIGWSKREKKAYRHKAPRRVVFLVSQTLQQAGQNGSRFVMEKILPIRDLEDDADVPAYQVYLSLAWFRKEKLVVQHGRQGYSLRPEINLTNAVEEGWKLLPKT